MRTLTEYIRNLSVNSLKNDLIQSGKWTNWHCFPDKLEDFCEFFDLADDGIISCYFVHTCSSYKKVCIYIELQFPEPVGKVKYDICFTVSGYKKPEVDAYGWGGTHGEVDIDFERKYLPPIKKGADKYPIIYDLTNDAICHIINNDTTVGEIIDGIINNVNKLLPFFKKTFDAFYDGTYDKVFKKTGIKPHNGNYTSDGLLLPCYCSIVNLMYLAKEKCDYDMSVEEAAMLNLYTYDSVICNYTTGSSGNSKHIINTWSFWNRGEYKNAENIEITKKQLKDIINAAAKDLIVNIDEIAEYREALNNANKYILGKLKEAINEASKQFGIKANHLCLHGFADPKNWKMFDEDITKAPKNWKLNTPKLPDDEEDSYFNSDCPNM